MARFVNKVTLLGNVGGDPEVRSFQNGGRVLTFNLATGESWKDGNGERKERTTWHRVSIFVDGLIDVAEQYVRKGSKLYIEGKLENREWTDQAGIKRYSTEVALRPFRSELVLLGDPGSRNEGAPSAPRRERAPAGAGAGDGYLPGRGDLDAEIPFAPSWQ